MLTRRALVASTAALAAGCGAFRSSPDLPSEPDAAALTWYTFSFSGLFDRSEVLEGPQERLPKIIAALEEDVENPNGPARGRYTLSPRLIGRADYPDPPPQNDDEFAEWIGGIDTDLLSISPSMAESLGKRGVILPLDRFIAADDQGLTETFYPYVLDQFRGEGGLFALPLNADPLMLYYNPLYFAVEGMPPPDESWDWDDLVENAVKMTRRDARWHGDALGARAALWRLLVGVVAERCGGDRSRDGAVPVAGAGRHRSLALLSRPAAHPSRRSVFGRERDAGAFQHAGRYVTGHVL